jgi:hypothetical protein
MRNDPPTSMHMAYGYRESRAFGVTNFRESRSTREILTDLKANKMGRELLSAIEADRGWERFVVHWLSEGLSIAVVADALHNAKFYAWLRTKKYSTAMLTRYEPF